MIKCNEYEIHSWADKKDLIARKKGEKKKNVKKPANPVINYWRPTEHVSVLAVFFDVFTFFFFFLVAVVVVVVVAF